MGSEVPALGISHLHRFWAQQTAKARSEPQTEQDKDWVADNTLLAGLRVGLRETYDYLLNNPPDFAEFEQWLLARNGGSLDAPRIERLNVALSDAGRSGQPANPDAEPALSTADLEFWDQNGYVILHDAVPPENCQAAANAICEFLEVRLDRPDTWYGGPQGHSIWIPLLHHPALWAIAILRASTVRLRGCGTAKTFGSMWIRRVLIRRKSRGGNFRARICIGM